ncbi:lactococcin 972 family bacteriocin [Streptococcus suis]|uniref:hypothetical protein n=1 Tax=Streptococcus suis TaxID=1307 RepID=UPI0007697D4E|nr:lactococcin 972 family bacteriocin [Streptococcus suis]
MVIEVERHIQTTTMEKKYHYSSVISRKDADSSRGEAEATKTSYATIKIVKDEKAAFYYDYD